jgi:release factor glutamine methyltransferase
VNRVATEPAVAARWRAVGGAEPDALALAAGPLRLRRLRRWLGRGAHRALLGAIERRHNAYCLETVLGLPLLVVPGVLNPVLMRTGGYLAAQLASWPIAARARVLDMGTGSGVCAVVAAGRSRHVVAADINPAAVFCATANAQLHGVEDRVEVVHSDLFGGLAGRCFDLVLFNPPFLEGEPGDAGDRAWRSPDVAARFARDLPAHLAPDGEALVLLSTFGRPALFLEQFQNRGLSLSLVAAREFVNERLLLVRVGAARRAAGLHG